jgi:hypothetical protein
MKTLGIVFDCLFSDIKMMHIVLSLLLFSLCNHLGLCAQPYFPSQIVFSLDDGTTTIAIDEINQRAYLTYPMNALMNVTAYVIEHFPYAIRDSPQSKHYVFLAGLFFRKRTTITSTFCESNETLWVCRTCQCKHSCRFKNF